MSQPFLGEIRMFAGNFAPIGWALCNGQTMPISQNTALFSILGTTFGGNGTTTFNLPDLQGRVPVNQGTGAGLSSYLLGQTGGTESTTLLIGNMPSHNHLVQCNTGGGNQASPSANLPAVESTGTSLDFSDAGANATMNPAMIQSAGSGTPINNIQPYLCVNFIIALEGIFPSRN
ncbi:MAG: tail fiber protein [Verrucomicrobiota bacterium]|jgi:microcystin-dependent protein